MQQRCLHSSSSSLTQPWRTELHPTRNLTAAPFLVFGCLFSLIPELLEAAETTGNFEREIRPILARYCTDCHDANTAKADLRVDTLDGQLHGEQGETWHDILNRVSIGEMPPRDAEQLPTHQRRMLTGWIRSKLKKLAAQNNPGGQTVLRRLTRYEYNNTLRDLTGIALDYSVDLPPDSNSPNGFKNNGSVLGISPLQLEYYVGAARKAMSTAIVTDPAPHVHRHHFETSSPSNAPNIKTAIGNRMTPGGRFFGKMLEYPREGEFVIRVKASSLIPAGLEVPRMRVSLGLRSDTVSPTKLLGEIDVANPENAPKVYEFRGRIEEFPLPGHNPKFPGVTIVVSNECDDGHPPEADLVYPRIKFTREEAKRVASRAKERAFVFPEAEIAGLKIQDKRLREITKAAESLQKNIEELRLVDPNSDAVVDLACRLFEVNNSSKKLRNSIKQLCKQQKLDHASILKTFDTENAEEINDHRAVLSKFQHLTPVSRKDKKALRALLPPGPPRSTLVLESLEFEGPIYDHWPPDSHRRLLPELPDVDAPLNDHSEGGIQTKDRQHAQFAIQRFMKRAFRRPITDHDSSYVLDYFNEVHARSNSFELAMREAFVMILVSPEFLFHVEASPTLGPRPLTQHEIATRLSYFLWSTTPDTQLTQLADLGQLLNPSILEAQVRRLLKSPQSSEFVTHFTDQWLDLSGLDRVAINPEYYPGFDDALKTSMRQETHSFFAEVLHKELNALNLLDSDFLMLNGPLAKHYGLTGPKGGRFERVDLADNSRRGGLLTQASVLLLNSTGEDSHPIRRGVWLRSRLLDDPPAPPPPDVPELDSQSAKIAGQSVRQQLEHHSRREACNDCHRGIDPWGIPFEHFDAIGKYRTEAVRLQTGKRKPLQVDVSSQTVLPSGKSIDNMHDLKTHLLKSERRRFASALVSRLLEYGTGRNLVFQDQASIEQLTDQFEASEYRLSDLIVAIVQSKPFQNK